tara:strand:+ start:479 stop:721 length:243 start_codon:yes stop_codon:yes gene_type:complete
MNEMQLLTDFTNQLAMCELLSAYSIIEPSLAHHCREISDFVQESYFDNNYQAFITWWDKTVMPLTNELNTLYLEMKNESL